MNKSNKNIVPFGKYKGQSIEIVQADAKYAEWLAAQQWFRERFVDLFKALTAIGAQADTPEHNRMQAKFLNEPYRSRFIQTLYNLDSLTLEHRRDTYEDRVVELLRQSIPQCPSFADSVACKFWIDSKWQRALSIINQYNSQRKDAPTFPEILGRMKEFLPDFVPPVWNEHTDTIDLKSTAEFEFHGSDVLVIWSWRIKEENCAGRDRGILVELKPSLGDDFPSVLREIKSHMQIGARHLYLDAKTSALVVGQYNGEGATWEEVIEFFRSSGILAILESDIGA